MRQTGLNDRQVAEARIQHGFNELAEPPSTPAWKLFLGKFKDPLIILLCAGAVLSLLTGGAVEALGILLAVILSAGIGFAGEYRASKAFALLKQSDESALCKVFRNGAWNAVPGRELVPGDLVALESGEEIPADGEFLSGPLLRVDESKFTGEAEPALKLPLGSPDFARHAAESAYPPEMLLRGTTVAEGSALMRVQAVGMATVLGKTARAAAAPANAPTPLQKQLGKLGRVVAVCGITASSLLAAALIFRAAHAGTIGEWHTWLDILMIAVTLIVVTVPEGLPMSVTLSLACAMRRMARDRVLIRKLHAAETIGAATVICTDKTGTLTLNRMRVAAMHFPDASHALVDEALAVNATAEIGSDGEKVLGNPTEGALLLELARRGADYRELRERAAVTRQLPFDTKNKFMTSLTGCGRLHIKGAPEIVLAHARFRMDESGSPRELDDEMRQRFMRAFADEQSRGRRVLGFACREGAESIEPDQQAVFLGFAAIADPVRPDVPGAVAACKAAGVRVKIVTGDSGVTAAEIGRQIGIKNPVVFEGRDFAAIPDEQLPETARRLDILARARPEDKLRLVRALQSLDEVVAVTGDGTNDAPALRHADVGIAMGVTGTAVAREAADVVLLDDSFKSIVNAVLWGRSLYLNIQRFLVFQLTVNASAGLIALAGPFLGIELPFTVIQMLWINLIMDTFAALALATEPPTPQVMNAPPRNPNAFIVSHGMAKLIAAGGGLFALLFVLLKLWAPELFDAPRTLTMIFCAFVFCQFWNLLNARTMGSGKPFFQLRGNPWFAGIAAVIAIGQIAITQFGGTMFRTAPLGFAEWTAVIAGTSILFWGPECMRFFRCKI